MTYEGRNVVAWYRKKDQSETDLVLFYFHYLIKPEMTDISESVSLAQSEPH
jgi:hypothetical protein